MSSAKTAVPIDMQFGTLNQVGQGGHIGAIWRTRLNRPCAAAMRPYVKLL